MSSGSIYKLAVVGHGFQNQLLVCRFHYKANQGTILDTQPEDLAEAWMGSAHDFFRDTFSQNCTADKLEVRGVSNPSEGIDIPLDPGDGPGTIGGETLPPAASCLVNWYTGLIGRRFRGKNYLWPTSEASQNAGVWENAYLATVQAFANAILTIGDGITTATYSLVVHSVAGTGSNIVVTMGRPSSVVAYQKRRKQGVGA